MEARIKFLRCEKPPFGKDKIFATKETQKNRPLKKGGFKKIGAGNGIRTHDINLGKVALYP